MPDPAPQIVPGSFHQNESLDLVHFPDHYNGWSGNPKPIDSVKVRPIAETSTRVFALLKGEIDATDSYLPADQVERIEKRERPRIAR